MCKDGMEMPLLLNRRLVPVTLVLVKMLAAMHGAELEDAGASLCPVAALAGASPLGLWDAGARCLVLLGV